MYLHRKFLLIKRNKCSLKVDDWPCLYIVCSFLSAREIPRTGKKISSPTLLLSNQEWCCSIQASFLLHLTSVLLFFETFWLEYPLDAWGFIHTQSPKSGSIWSVFKKNEFDCFEILSKLFRCFWGWKILFFFLNFYLLAKLEGNSIKLDLAFSTRCCQWSVAQIREKS